MNKKQNDTHDNVPSRKSFILTGVAVGALISVWYLYRLHLQKTMPGVYVKIDPLWAQFVNVALIFSPRLLFCCGQARGFITAG